MAKQVVSQFSLLKINNQTLPGRTKPCYASSSCIVNYIEESTGVDRCYSTTGYEINK